MFSPKKIANIYTVHINLDPPRQRRMFSITPDEIIDSWKKHIYSKAVDNEFKKIINEDDKNIISLSIYLSFQDKDIIFGTLSKIQSLYNKPLQRMSDINNAPIDTTKLRIEDYTYFYFDLSMLQCSVLSNRKAPQFKSYFQNFLNSLSPHYISVHITNTLSENFNQKLNKTANLLSASFMFTSSSPFGLNNMKLQDAMMIYGKDVEKVRVEITYRHASLSEEEIAILKKQDYMQESCTKAELKIDDEEGNEEIVLDAVNHYLTKKISLNLNDGDLLDHEKIYVIKEALANCLINP